MKLVLTTLAALTLIGCAPPRANPPVNTTATSKPFTLPSVGQTATKDIGESLLKTGRRVTVVNTVATLLDDASSSMDLGHTLNVSAGESAPLLSRMEDGTKLACFLTGGVGIAVSGRVAGCLVGNNGVFESSTFQTRVKYFPLTKPVRYIEKQTEHITDKEPEFYTDVLYQGLTRGEVKISFREFRGGLARPSFTQDINYELAPNGTGMIAFKGIRIKILKATGQDITYSVQRAESGD